MSARRLSDEQISELSRLFGYVPDPEPLEQMLSAVERIVNAALKQQAAAIAAQRVVCPVHGIPDCSPLLNGCSLPNHLSAQRDADARIARAHGEAQG